ncbi:MAG: SUF system NifU family Fe-S cluster assembly protein [Patescibacteria group bacterium]
MDIYAQNILDHYKHPRNYGSLPDADLRQKGINATCGDEISVALKLSGQKIKEIRFLGRGCAISQAAISILTEELIGQTKKDVLALSFADIKRLLGVPISERRYKCAMLGLEAIQAALRD